MASNQSQSQGDLRMHTRSQAASQGGGVTDTSAPGDVVPEIELGSGERSSVTANQTQTQPAVRLSATDQNIEPVLSASDRRIKNLLAQTSIEKMMLDNHIKDMTKMAERHIQYVKDGEGAEMLGDRAVQLKSKVRKGE